MNEEIKQYIKEIKKIDRIDHLSCRYGDPEASLCSCCSFGFGDDDKYMLENEECTTPELWNALYQRKQELLKKEI